MEEDEEIREENLAPRDLAGEDHEQEEVEEETATEEEAEGLEPLPQTSYRPKLSELLRNLCSSEVKIYSEASKEFVGLLKGNAGGDVLFQYVRDSLRCSELMEVWRLRRGKPGMVHVMQLLTAVLEHPLGRSRSGRISWNLDALARSIVGTRLEDIHTELKSEDDGRQAAALFLLATIVRRGVGLAWVVAENFDFKLRVIPKLTGFQKMKGGKEAKQHPVGCSRRRAFVEFAMSFLEVGDPCLLGSILNQKYVYPGVFCRLGSDDVETVIHVLSIVRDKVLTADSLVPLETRSVLFGSVTLEQLSYISGNPLGGPAADVAHEVLVMVCMNPCNGLMPDSNLKGNVKRLSDFMKKLKATEVKYHKDLLLAIVKGRPSLCSSYMDEFPYHLEPRASPLWYSAISLAADLISSTSSHPFDLLTISQSLDPPTLDSAELQCIMKCIVPRSFTRTVINKGLLHSDILVKHGSLRLLLEALKSLDILFNSIDDLMEKINVKRSIYTSGRGDNLLGLIGSEDAITSRDFIKLGKFSNDETRLQKCASLKQNIQDEVRAALPDPQVLLKLLSSFSYKSPKTSKMSLKRCAHFSQASPKKLRMSDNNAIDGNIDIVISGIGSKLTNYVPEENENVKDEGEMDIENHTTAIAEIWGPQELNMITNDLNDVEFFFQSKLLVVLTFYLRTMPIALEGSFDFFKILPSNPLSLSSCQQQSLLSFLIEYIGQSPESRASIRAPDFMYKNLQPLVSLLIFSPVKGIQNQAFALVRAAMLSTGAFDQNISEIDAWFLFLPGFSYDEPSGKIQGGETFKDLSAAVILFLCDAVSTLGNNLYKYLDYVRGFIFKLEGLEDICPNFSPLVVCILQKCLRVLESDSGTFNLSERSMISLYACNTLSFLMQTQVDICILPGLINSLLTENFQDSCSTTGNDGRRSLCEWRPLNNLLNFSQSILQQKTCYALLSVPGRATKGDDSSFSTVLCEVRDFLEHEHGTGSLGVAVALCSSIICATHDDLLENFPLLVIVAQHLPGALHILSLALFLGQTFLASVANLWPEMFSRGLEIIGGGICNNCVNNDAGYSPFNDSGYFITGRFILSKDLHLTQSAAVAFSLFLEHTPFYTLFYAIMNSHSCNLLMSTKMIDLLKAKLDEGTNDNSMLSLRVMLFWAYLIRSSYRTEPSDYLEKLFEICFSLIEHILEHLLKVCFDTGTFRCTGPPALTNYALKVADLIFQHPIISLSFSNPLYCGRKHAQEGVEDSLEDLFISAKQSVHPMDHQILQLLNRVADSVFALKIDQKLASEFCLNHHKSVLRAFRDLVQQSISLFREGFDLCGLAKDSVPLLPSFYILCALMRFISPFELVELVNWMFYKFKDNRNGQRHLKVSALSIGLYVADGAFDMLCNLLHRPNMNTFSQSFWEIRDRNFAVFPLQDVYCKILELAVSFKLESADLCLSKVVNAVYCQKFIQTPAPLLPLNMLLSRIITSSPMEYLTHCIYKTCKTKARTLFELTEVSPLHLSLFGLSFLGIINKGLSSPEMNANDAFPPKGGMVDQNCNCTLSDEDFMLLLPAALSYLTSHLLKLKKQDPKILGTIPSFYSRIILNGFSNWNSYTTGKMFHENFDKVAATTLEEFLDGFRGTLLGKAVHMLWYSFILSGRPMKKHQRLNIFDSMYPQISLHDELLDCDLTSPDLYLYKEPLNLINRVIAKISFTRLLLFPPKNFIQISPVDVDECFKEMPRKESKRVNSAKLRFLNILINTWDKIVRRFPLNKDHCHSADSTYLMRFLEFSILRNIVQLSMEIQSFLIQLPSIPFLEPFIKCSLLHRFEDPVTLKAVRIILCTLEGKFSSSEILELLLAHSQFVSTILSTDSFSDLSGSINIGTLLRPVPGFFKLVDLLSPIPNAAEEKSSYDASLEHSDKHALEKGKLELIKLLRVLFYLKVRHQNVSPGDVIGMNLRELLSLLLSGYGATLSEIDLEILHLMHDIELIEGPDCKHMEELDYLWGSSALKIRKEQTLAGLAPSNKIADCETTEEQRRRLFRENIPVDSKLCVMTALHFCYDRVRLTAPMSLENLIQDNFINIPEQTLSRNVERIKRYDPAFILRFAIHSLSRGYIEPVEFARLGLLAVALVSISSPDEEMRKLGYETLGHFKTSLERFQNSKDALQLQLLLAYLQNGIIEAWQKVPSIIAVFAAEASFILLDPSQNHFYAISKHLMRSPKVDLKGVPLFHTLFGGDSVNFKIERLWILQLLYIGLNLNDDAQIFKGKSICELLLSFYVSHLSDSGTKVLILQIVKKAVKLHMLARLLVEHCGLISWLCSVLLFNVERLRGDQKHFSLKQMELILEIINDVVSLRAITEWLKKDALEQLSRFSSFVHMIFLHSLKLLKENVSLINSMLHVMLSTLRISQKRKIFQPHFTLSLEALFQLFQAIEGELKDTKFSPTIHLGLNIILMGTPLPVLCQTDKSKLSDLVMWATSSALQSHSTEISLINNSDPDVENLLEEQRKEESLLSKFLRWLTASVILGSISSKCCKRNASFPLQKMKMETLQSLMEGITKEQCEKGHCQCNSNETLAIIILHLQHLLGQNCAILPSVVSALCLLLLSDDSNPAETKYFDEDHRNLVASLCSKIRYPSEADPSWRWSFYQPWKDLSLEQTDLQIIEERHACQTLLLLFSSSVGGKSSGLTVPLHREAELSRLFDWERSIVIGNG